MAGLDARETLFLELVNRARLDPAGEAARQGLPDLNQNLAAGTLNSAPKQILVWNSLLSDAADAHAAWMNAADVFSHTGNGGTTPTQRMQAAGYPFSGGYSTGENISWSGSSNQASYDANAQVLAQHKSLFLSAGHRENILNSDFREVGIGTDLGFFVQNTTNFYGMMSAFDFVRAGSAHFLGGVAYGDSSGDDFYSIGEGQGGISVQLLSGTSVLATTATQTAGAFTLATTAAGALEIVFNGNAGADFVMAGNNEKFDFVDSNTIETNVSATLTRSAANLRLLGIEDIDGSGNGLANHLTGNAGNNVLNGAGGDDVISGGGGSDTVVLSGAAASYAISKNAAGAIVLSLNGSTDTVSGVENFKFADRTIALADLTFGSGPAPTPDPTPTPTPVPEPTPTINVIKGNFGINALTGTSGDDRIFGYGGADTLKGFAGNDRLNGGTGHDVLNGGAGQDRFDFSAVAKSANSDVIRDFNVADDTIGLRKTIFAALGSTITAGEFYTGAAAHDTSDHLIYNSQTGALTYDADGKGGTGGVTIAKLAAGLALTVGDFVLI